MDLIRVTEHGPHTRHLPYLASGVEMCLRERPEESPSLAEVAEKTCVETVSPVVRDQETDLEDSGIDGQGDGDGSRVFGVDAEGGDSIEGAWFVGAIEPPEFHR